MEKQLKRSKIEHAEAEVKAVTAIQALVEQNDNSVNMQKAPMVVVDTTTATSSKRVPAKNAHLTSSKPKREAPKSKSAIDAIAEPDLKAKVTETTK